jgi:hypothetical protein
MSSYELRKDARWLASTPILTFTLCMIFNQGGTEMAEKGKKDKGKKDRKKQAVLTPKEKRKLKREKKSK